MAVSKESTRALIVLPKNVKRQLEDKAKKENRSMSNYVLNLILKDLEQSGK